MNNGSNLKIKIPLYEKNTIQKIYTHLDYLRFSFNGIHKKRSKIMHNIDTDNTNQYYDDNYTYIKLQLSMGPCLQICVVHEGMSVPIILYNEFDAKTKIITKRESRIDFYGSYFRLFDVFGEKYEDNIISILGGFDSDTAVYISRVDIASDVFLKEQQYLPPIEEICRSDTRRFQYRPFYARGGKLVSCEIGNPESLGVFSRVYHKTIELLSKGKGFLYRDYLTYGAVHRYEIQFGSRYCKGLQFQSLPSFLVQVEQLLTDSVYHGGLIQGFYHYTEPNPNKIKVDKYAKDILGRCATYARNGYNPFLLLHDWLPSKIGPTMHESYLTSFLDSISPKNSQKKPGVSKKKHNRA